MRKRVVLLYKCKFWTYSLSFKMCKACLDDGYPPFWGKEPGHIYDALGALTAFEWKQYTRRQSTFTKLVEHKTCVSVNGYFVHFTGVCNVASTCRICSGLWWDLVKQHERSLCLKVRQCSSS